MPLKAPPVGGAWRGGGVAAAAAGAGRQDRTVPIARRSGSAMRRHTQGRRSSSIDMHTAQEEVASKTQHHSAIINLALGAAAAARCTVADRAINAPLVQPYLFIGPPCRPVPPPLTLMHSSIFL